MKKNIFLIVFATLAIASCSKTKTADISANNSANLANSVNTNSVKTNSVTNSNVSIQNKVSETKSEVNSEMLKQIEAQQLETADPRKITNKANSNQSPKKTVPAGQQNY